MAITSTESKKPLAALNLFFSHNFEVVAVYENETIRYFSTFANAPPFIVAVSHCLSLPLARPKLNKIRGLRLLKSNDVAFL